MSTWRPPAADVASTITRPSAPSGRRTSVATPVDVSLWVRAYTSTSGTAFASGCVPGGDSMTSGSSRNGVAATLGRRMVRRASAHRRVSARIGGIEESATLAIDARAKALKDAGEDVIGFGAGEPDFPTPEHIVEAARAACAVVRFHHYTPAAGLPELRQAIAAKTARDSGHRVEAAHVLVT